MGMGKVYLIGAGPGDIELLTLKAVRAIKACQVILLDSLANPDVLQFASDSARVIEVGKRGGRESVPQAEIEQQMIEHARSGLTIGRIKGGDPLIFARGGEEIEALVENGVPFEVIPGVTAATGICATLGISLTHRDLSHCVIYLAGPHFEPPTDMLRLPDMKTFAGTLVIYMALKSSEHVSVELIRRGLDPATPSVAVQSGTLPSQRAVFGRLDALPSLINQSKLGSPVLIIVGHVVALCPSYGVSGASNDYSAKGGRFGFIEEVTA